MFYCLHGLQLLFICEWIFCISTLWLLVNNAAVNMGLHTSISSSPCFRFSLAFLFEDFPVVSGLGDRRGTRLVMGRGVLDEQLCSVPVTIRVVWVRGGAETECPTGWAIL